MLTFFQNKNKSKITDFLPELRKDRSNVIYNADTYRLIDMNGYNTIPI